MNRDPDFDKDKDAPPDEAEFDQTLLDDLNEDLGPETFVFLLGQCIEDVGVRLKKLSGLPSAAADSLATRALAHQLKGLFLQFGAQAAARDATALEAAAPAEADEKREKLRQSATRALALFEQARAKV